MAGFSYAGLENKGGVVVGNSFQIPRVRKKRKKSQPLKADSSAGRGKRERDITSVIRKKEGEETTVDLLMFSSVSV